MSDSGPTGRRFEFVLHQSTLTFPLVVHDRVNKGLGMSSKGYMSEINKIDKIDKIEVDKIKFPGGSTHQDFMIFLEKQTCKTTSVFVDLGPNFYFVL